MVTVPVRRRTIISESLVLKRVLEHPGKIFVKVGDEVTPDKVIGEFGTTAGFRQISLARGLEVKKDFAKFLTKSIGDKVWRGEVIAVRKGWFKNWQIDSPVDGRLKELDSQTGNLTIEFGPRIEKVPAGCWGRVVEIVGKKELEIATTVTQITGVIGTGNVREGAVKLLAPPNGFLLPTAIDSTLAGRIIFGGAQITKEALTKALTLGVAGIIAGGMHARDFWASGGGVVSVFGKSSDIGLSIILLSGFGFVPVDSQIFQLLKKNEGKYGLIDGNGMVLTIPLPEVPKHLPKTVPEAQPKTRQLKVGDLVQVTGFSNFGKIGQVTRINQKPEILASGLESIVVQIQTDSQVIAVPSANLQILV